MKDFNWSVAKSTLKGFGGTFVNLYVLKTGLPFFDALRLYGAIDLYIGLREDVVIHDLGDRWKVCGRCRGHMVRGKDKEAFNQVYKKKKINAEQFCAGLQSSLKEENGVSFKEEKVPATRALSGLDASLQAGIRDTAAKAYETLQTGQTSESTCCVAKIPLSDGLLAFAGKKRVEKGVGDIIFLPIFEGQVDLSKVVSPLNARIGVPNVLCAQALALLMLKTSLFAEGYQDRLTAVVFNTNFSGQRSDKYSGMLTIASTAIGRMRSASFVAHVYHVFREFVGKAWKRQGRNYQSTELTSDALGMAYWLMQPVGKHLLAMITAQERLCREGIRHVLNRADYAKEMFEMTYGNWKGDHEAVRKLARAVASGIYFARMAEEEDHEKRRKVWYDEVVMLRSAPSAKAFIERAMILIEQGHRKCSQVGTGHRDEDFNPEAVFCSIGESRNSFETFRDLFRMYLVQESTYQSKEKPAGEVPLEPATDDLKTELEEYKE